MKAIKLGIIIVGLIFCTPVSLAKQKLETISGPKSGTPEHVVIQAIKAGIAGDFNAYLATVHPEHKEKKAQIKQRRKYEWKRFKKQASWYVMKRTPFTIQVTSRRPESAKYYRIFIKDQTHPERMPVPVRLKKSGSSWKIMTNSM